MAFVAVADDLDDLFASNGSDADASLSTDGVAELFSPVADESLEVGPADVLFPTTAADPDLLTLPPDRISEPTISAADAVTTPMNELLSSLAADLQQLASDIHQLLADDDKT